MTTNLLKTQGTSGQIKPPHVNTVCKSRLLETLRDKRLVSLTKTLTVKQQQNSRINKRWIGGKHVDRKRHVNYSVSGPCSDLDSKHYQTNN